MITYTRKEIVSATEIARGFGNILDRLHAGDLDKIAVLRNNKMEAVVLSLEEYERIAEESELFEHSEIFKIVKAREETDETEYLPLNRFLQSCEKK